MAFRIRFTAPDGMWTGLQCIFCVENAFDVRLLQVEGLKRILKCTWVDKEFFSVG